MSKALYTNNNRTDLKMVHGTNKQVAENREIVKIVIDALLYTARQNVALRGIMSINYLTIEGISLN